MSSPVIIRPYRALVPGPDSNGVAAGAIAADAVIEEDHEDEMTITENPVEQGSVIADHAFKNPCELRLTYIWALGSSQNSANNPSFLNTLYQLMLTLQANRTLFQIYTGKRSYTNMLCKSIRENTDKDTEQVLSVTLGFREIIIVGTSTITVSPANMQQYPQSTSGVVPQGNQNLQPGSKANPGGVLSVVGGGS